MSSNEEEPWPKKSKMDPVSKDTSSSSLEHADSTSGGPAIGLGKKFSIITAMMDSVPDILVDNVLSDVEFGDWFAFKCASHRCQDIVNSNLNRLKKPEKRTAVRIEWANNTKTLTFGRRLDFVRREDTKTFSISPSVDGQQVEDPPNSSREGSLLFEKETRRYGIFSVQEVTKVRSIGGEEEDAVAFLLKKFLPRMLVNGIYADQLEKSDFMMLAEVLKTHAIRHSMNFKVNLGARNTGLRRVFAVRAGLKLGGAKPSLLLEDVMPILVKERVASISLRDVHSDVAIPKSFFESPLRKNIVKISLKGRDILAKEFDDELLLTTLPHLKELAIGESNVTAVGLNALLKEYIAGTRDFNSISLILHHPNESIEKDELWAELVDGIPWTDYKQPLIRKGDAGYEEHNLGMSFLASLSNRGVEFFTNKSKSWREMIADADDDEED